MNEEVTKITFRCGSSSNIVSPLLMSVTSQGPPALTKQKNMGNSRVVVGRFSMIVKNPNIYELMVGAVVIG